MQTDSISVTVAYSLIRVKILQRVSINIISHLLLKFFIITEYKPWVLLGPNGMTRNFYFWFDGKKKANFHLSTLWTENWLYPYFASSLIIQMFFDPEPTVLIASSQWVIRISKDLIIPLIFLEERNILQINQFYL